MTLSNETLEWLESLGDFKTGLNGEIYEMVGRADGAPWFMPADGWRELAAACQEVAEFLDAKNAKEKRPYPRQRKRK